MPKIPIAKPRAVIRVLERAGFYFARQKGSHRLYKKNHLRVTVPVHNKDLILSTTRRIIEQSGMTIKEFTELL